MRESRMTLGSEDITRIAKEVAPAVKELLAREQQAVFPSPPPDVWDRIVVIERELLSHGQELRLMNQELKSQRELMEARFEAIDKRFETVDKRFEAMDKRFECDRQRADQRFEAIDRRFEDLRHYADKRFAALTWSIGFAVTLITGLMTAYRFLIP